MGNTKSTIETKSGKSNDIKKYEYLSKDLKKEKEIVSKTYINGLHYTLTPDNLKVYVKKRLYHVIGNYVNCKMNDLTQEEWIVIEKSGYTKNHFNKWVKDAYHNACNYKERPTYYDDKKLWYNILEIEEDTSWIWYKRLYLKKYKTLESNFKVPTNKLELFFWKRGLVKGCDMYTQFCNDCIGGCE